MKQGRKTLEEFINKFDDKLLNTGGMFWNDALKKILLETGVNWQILKKLIRKECALIYNDYCEQLWRIDYNILLGHIVNMQLDHVFRFIQSHV